MMNETYLSLGSNEGDREACLNQAISMVTERCGKLVQRSSVYETVAWGLEDQPDFLNLVINIRTEFQPLELLHAIQQIEQDMGRQRKVKWGQRTLDIDILFYNDDVITLPELSVPHPYLQERRFTMVPLNEIAPQKLHPVLHLSMKELLEKCPDHLPVHLYTPATGNAR